METNNSVELSNKEKELAIIEMQDLGAKLEDGLENGNLDFFYMESENSKYA